MSNEDEVMTLADRLNQPMAVDTDEDVAFATGAELAQNGTGDPDSDRPADGITLTPTAWKVSATEKRSTGEYENYQPHVTIEGEIGGVEDLDEAGRRALAARLLSLQKMAKAVVTRAADNRTRADGHEDWGLQAGDEV